MLHEVSIQGRSSGPSTGESGDNVVLGYAEIIVQKGTYTMTNQRKKGLFVVLDGNDGSGKQTQAQNLVARLQSEGRECLLLSFPEYDNNLFGALLAECLAGKRGDFVHLDPHMTSTLYAADRFESSAKIRAALEEGKVVIADRFTSSNQIHQGGKISDENERITFLAWLDRMEHETFAIPRPDVIIYLKVPVETSLVLLADKRRAKNINLDDGEMDQVESDREYLDRSHETAGWLMSRQENWCLIDCLGADGLMRSREEIGEDVLATIKPFVE